MHHHESLASSMLDSYEAYGCKVNAISVDELFRKYEQAGFLYPAKMQRLAPFMDLVRDNWKRAFRSGDALLYVVSIEQQDGAWALLSSWRSTNGGWNMQHLVGLGGPAGSRAVMQATCAFRIKHSTDLSHQNWFQRTNRFTNKVFGSITETLGPSVAWVGDFSYFSVGLRQCPTPDESVVVRNYKNADHEAIRALAVVARSTVFAAAEQLDAEDIGLESVDDLYQKAGLRRYRRVLIAEIEHSDQIAGLALVYRGPLGFNFSFLENRCDLLVDPALSETQRQIVTRSLLAAAGEHYTDFPPGYVPTIVDRKYRNDIDTIGGEHLRDYAQSAWVRDGFLPMYRHTERVYDRVIRVEGRRGLSRTKGQRP